MTRCAGIKADGERCKGVAIHGYQWCAAHHPDYQEQRRRNAQKGGKRGGRGRAGPPEVRAVQGQIRSVISEVLSGSVDKGTGSVVFAGFSVLLRAIEQERRLRELEEIEARIAGLEEAYGNRGSNRRWG